MTLQEGKGFMQQTQNSELKVDRSEPDEAPRVGVYVCYCGGNISDVVDVEEVARSAAGLPHVVVARTNMFMCSDAGQAMIVEDIQKEGLNRVVVASCSPKLHELTFRGVLKRAGLNEYLYEHANIREQVSWVHHAQNREATEKALRLVAAATSKAARLEPLRSIRVDAHSHALVVGGGVSGLKSALDLARRGVMVTLVEREPFLGGQVSVLHRVYPTEESATDIVLSLVEAVLREPRIQVLTRAEVVEASGSIGNFKVLIRREGAVAGRDGKVPRISYQAFRGCHLEGDVRPASNMELTVGSIVMATGFQHYEPSSGEYGYRENPRVITLPDFIRVLSSEGPSGGNLLWEGRPVKAVAFIHCVGSRQIPGIHEPGEDGRLHEYCSRVCCTATLQAATELKERFPQIHVYDLYRDIRTYGRGHEDYYEKASKLGCLFFRFEPEEPPSVSPPLEGSDYSLAIKVKDSLTWKEEVEVEADLVVLAVGMVPRRDPKLVTDLKLPVGTDGFLLEVHPKLRPVEVSVGGVLLAGASQGPKDITESCASASAAAAKASAILSRGYIDLEPFVARVDQGLCDGCGACVEECGYEGAIQVLESDSQEGARKVSVNPALCRGCGACVAVCPHRAIDVAGWTLDQYEAMVDALAGGMSAGGVR